MRGKRAKEIRRAFNALLEKNQKNIVMGYKRFPWGQVVNQRRHLYKTAKSAAQGLKWKIIITAPSAQRGSFALRTILDG